MTYLTHVAEIGYKGLTAHIMQRESSPEIMVQVFEDQYEEDSEKALETRYYESVASAFRNIYEYMNKVSERYCNGEYDQWPPLSSASTKDHATKSS